MEQERREKGAKEGAGRKKEGEGRKKEGEGGRMRTRREGGGGGGEVEEGGEVEDEWRMSGGVEEWMNG